MSIDDSPSVNPCVTLGDLRRITATLPDDTPIVIETAEDDLLYTYERLALALSVKAYPGGATVINLADIPEGRAA